MNVRRVIRAVIAGVLTAAGPLAFAAPARAATCTAATTQDFDDDGRADLVVARTLPTSRAGVVEIRMSSGTTQTVSAATLGFDSAANDQFGAAVHIGAIDGSDNCPDLVIGAPGTAGGGAVYLVRGTGSGVATSAVRLESPAAGAGFGTSVGSMFLPLTRVRVLVGAPGLDVGSAADAGAVLVYPVDDGAPTGSPATLRYSDFGASPAAGDRLGSVMDVTSYQVTLGVPERDVASAADAGEVIGFTLVDEPGSPAVATWTRANQNSPGAPGVAETGDRFGSSVDFAGAYTFVGVPGEDIDGRRDAGAVARYRDLGDHTAGDWAFWHQNSPSVPGVNETGDRFGAAVHIGWVDVLVDGDPVSRQVYVVGAPGEDIGAVRDAGAVTILAPGVRPAFGLSQGSGLPGKAEKGDLVGAALGTLSGEYTGPYYGGDGIVVGAPGEDIGSVVDAGLVMSARGLLPKGRFTWSSASSLGSPVAGGRYGWTLPAA